MSSIATQPQQEIPPLAPSIKEGRSAVLPDNVGVNVLPALHLLWNGRRSIAKAFFGGLLSGCLIALLIPSRYQASVQLMPPDSQATSGLAMLAALSARTGGNLGGVAGDILGIKSSGALFVGILRSRTLQNRLIERFQLKKVYGVRLEEDARNGLLENTSISEDRKSGIITITATDRDRNRVAALASAYVEELNHLVAELSTSAAHRERVFLEERLLAVKQGLDQASLNFSQFESANKTIDIKEQARAMVQGAASVEGELIAAQSELKGLEEIYTESNVRVRTVRARIDELRRQLEKLGGPQAQEPDRAAELTAAAYPTIRRLPLLGVTYADLYRRVQIQEAIYETLTQQYELAKVQEAKETPSVKVLDATSVPERKSFPPRAIVAFLCASVATGGAVLALLARGRWADIPENHPGRRLALEVFGSVSGNMPWARPNGSKMQAASHRIWLRLTQGRSRQNGSENPAICS